MTPFSTKCRIIQVIAERGEASLSPHIVTRKSTVRKRTKTSSSPRPCTPTIPRRTYHASMFVALIYRLGPFLSLPSAPSSTKFDIFRYSFPFYQLEDFVHESCANFSNAVGGNALACESYDDSLSRNHSPGASQHKYPPLPPPRPNRQIARPHTQLLTSTSLQI